jgi:hypothetical protein
MAHYKIAFCVSLERNHSTMTVGHARLGMRRLQRTWQRLTVALIAAVFLGTPLVSAKSRTPQKIRGIGRITRYCRKAGRPGERAAESMACARNYRAAKKAKPTLATVCAKLTA